MVNELMNAAPPSSIPKREAFYLCICLNSRDEVNVAMNKKRMPFIRSFLGMCGEKVANLGHFTTIRLTTTEADLLIFCDDPYAHIISPHKRAGQNPTKAPVPFPSLLHR